MVFTESPWCSQSDHGVQQSGHGVHHVHVHGVQTVTVVFQKWPRCSQSSQIVRGVHSMAIVLTEWPWCLQSNQCVHRVAVVYKV